MYTFPKHVFLLYPVASFPQPMAVIFPELPLHNFNNKELKIGTFDGGEIITANNTSQKQIDACACGQTSKSSPSGLRD